MCHNCTYTRTYEQFLQITSDFSFLCVGVTGGESGESAEEEDVTCVGISD